MKKFTFCIILLISITQISCEEKLTVPDDFVASQGTYIGVVHIAYGAMEGRAVLARFNEDNGQWEDLIWTYMTQLDDDGYLLPNNSIIPNKVYRYKMRLHTEEAGFSEFSNEISGYAYRAAPSEITLLDREIDGNNLQITINLTNPNDLLEIKNLQNIKYDIYRTEAGNLSDFSKVETLDEVVINTNSINYNLSYTDNDYSLDPAKSYSYKIVTRYHYNYTDINGSYREDDYTLDGEVETDDGSNGNGGNPIVEYSSTDLGQMAAATSGGINNLSKKDINGSLYLGMINNADATGYGVPELYQFNGSVWQNVWTTSPENEFSKINYAIGSSSQYLAGIQDSLCVYQWSGSAWSDNLAPDNLGQADAPSALAIEVDNNELYMAIEQDPDYDLQVLKYNGSAWDTVGGDVNGVIASGTISEFTLEKLGSTLYLYYIIDNTLYIKHLSGTSWVTDLTWTKDYIYRIKLALNGNNDVYFISDTRNSAYRGGVYKVTSTTTAEEIMSNSIDPLFQFPISLTFDSNDNLIVVSMKYNEATTSFYPNLSLYDGTDWSTISGDFTGGTDPASVSALGTDLIFTYGDATTENASGDPMAIKSMRLAK